MANCTEPKKKRTQINALRAEHKKQVQGDQKADKEWAVVKAQEES